MKLSWRTEWFQWLLLAAMFGLALARWNSVPDRLPVHWGITGQVDRYGGRVEGLLVLPLMTLGLYVLLIILRRVDPGRENYERFAGSWHALRNVFTAFLVVLYGLMHASFSGRPLAMNNVLLPALGLLLIFLGNVMGKLRPNWFIGIRTPWTLTSKQSWIRSHRAGGWVLIAGGLGFVAAGLIDRLWLTRLVMIGFGAAVIAVSVYSWKVWKEDPDRLPPAGTRPA